MTKNNALRFLSAVSTCAALMAVATGRFHLRRLRCDAQLAAAARVELGHHLVVLAQPARAN